MASKHGTGYVVHTCVGEPLVASTQVLATQVPTTLQAASHMCSMMPSLIEMPPDHTVWKEYTTLEEVDAKLQAIKERQELLEKQGDCLERQTFLEVFAEMLRTGWMAMP